MNDRHDDPLDHSIRSALGDFVAESPTPGELPVRSLELRSAESRVRSRRPMLVAAAMVLIAGVAGTVAIVNRSTPSNTVTLDPEAAAEDLAEAQALLDEGTAVDPRPSSEITEITDTTLPGVPGTVPGDDAGLDPEAPPATFLPPERPGPDDTTPITVVLSNYTVFDVAVRRQVQAGGALLIEWSVEDPNGIEQTNARVGGASGWVSWCEFPMMGSRISGNERLGRYRAGCSVPGNAPNGEYTVFFQASSLVGAPSEPLGTSQVTFEVIGGSSDTTPPTISDVVVPQTASIGDSITITWRAVDPSGVNYSVAWFANGGFSLPDGTRVVDYGDLGVTRISGNEFDGVYSQTVRFYERSPLGTYTIWISRRDGVGNRSIDQVAATVVLTA